MWMRVYERGCVFMNVDVGVNVECVYECGSTYKCGCVYERCAYECGCVNVIIYPVNSLFLFRQG
jgi:hypothetical protein